MAIVKVLWVGKGTKEWRNTVPSAVTSEPTALSARCTSMSPIKLP